MSNPPVLAIQSYETILRLARQRTYEASNGLLNDTSEAGALSALLKSQSAAIADQNLILNSIVDVAVLRLLRAMGITISPGVPTRIWVTLVLTQPVPVDTIIPKFKIARSGIAFYTGGRVEVAAGLGTVRIPAVAAVYGVAGNVSPGTGVILEPQPLVQSVYFEEIIIFGEDPESLDTIPPQTLIDRLSAGSLTRTKDFERELKTLLGAGSVTLAIGKLSGDRQTQELGAVHVFGLNPDGSQLTAAQIQDLQLSIDNSSPLAKVYVSTIEVIPTQASVILVLADNADPQLVATDIWNQFASYVQPATLPVGEPVYSNKLVVLAGRVTGVDRVQSVTLGEWPGTLEPGNHLVPFKWSVARLDRLSVTVIYGDNSTAYTYTREVI